MRFLGRKWQKKICCGNNANRMSRFGSWTFPWSQQSLTGGGVGDFTVAEFSLPRK
jgi:hypothetical protein